MLLLFHLNDIGKKLIVADEEGENFTEWGMKMEQHQFVATSDLLQQLQINRKHREKRDKKRSIISLVAITIEFELTNSDVVSQI